MIEDTKWVKTLVEKAGGKSGKYHVVTWHDGKKDNLFEPALVEVCQQGLAQQLAVHYVKESSTRESDSKTFWNIVSAETVAPKETAKEVSALKPTDHIQPVPQEDEPPPEELGILDKAIAETRNIDRGSFAKYVVDDRTHDMHRQVALKCAVELVSHGFAKVGELKSTSNMLLKYLDGE